ncbi:MAG TPA: TonB-dependent receptor [Saprospiraceae bacterium]|nr:TonB-dependent receptor [Saprospiraceae bacterium]
MQFRIVLFFAMLFPFLAYSQEKGPVTIISGKVIEESTGLPLEFATVSLFSKTDNALLSGGLTGVDGTFSVEGSAKEMYILIEFLSFSTKRIDNIMPKDGQKSVTLGDIVIASDAVALETVEIVGEKSETTFALDKRVFNVGKDLSNRGGTAQDILDNVPSVTVDVDGGVSLRGSGNVRILIDGKPSGLVGIGGANGLRSLPANMIDRIEVITNPSAKFEAEGMSGIINIVLKKDNKAGINGSFEASGGWPENYGLGANLNYRKGKTNFFVNYGFNYNNNPSDGYTYQEAYVGDTTVASYILREGERIRLANSVRAGMDFSLSESQTLTGSFLYRYSFNDNNNPIKYFDHNFYGNEPRGRFLVPTLSYSLRTEIEKETSPTLEYTLDYIKRFKQEGRELKASVQFSSNDEVEKSDYTQGFYNMGNFEGNTLIQRAENAEDQQTIILQADYVHPFSKDTKFEGGLRSQLRDIRNDYLVEELEGTDWLRIDNLSNDFRYKEDVHAAYAIYGSKVNKFSYQGGLRLEYSDINTELLETNEVNPRTYFNLFPSGHINYEFAGKNQFQLSYTKRIQRPRFWDLNPFFTFADNRNIFSGNPNLNPEFTDSYELGHIKFWENGNIGTSLFWRHTTDVIQRVTTFNLDGTTNTRPLNLATSDNAGIEFLFAYNPNKWLKLDGNVNLFRNVIKGEFDGLDLGADSYSWFGRVGSRVSFWKNADFQLRFNYRAPVDIPQGVQFPQYIVDIAFSKDFWSNNASFTLAARDLFNSRRRNSEIFTDDFYQRVDQQWRRAPIVATVNYRLNMKKERKKPGREGEFEGGGDM